MSNLTTLKDDFRAKRFYDIAETIVKYQKFQNKYIIEKLSFAGLKDTMLVKYVSSTLKYLKSGERSKFVHRTYWDMVDEVILNHIQPLTPKENQKRRENLSFYHKKEAILPIQKVITEKKQTVLIDYGVKIGDSICICKNEKEAKGFLKGVLFCGKENAKIVTVEVQEVKEIE